LGQFPSPSVDAERTVRPWRRLLPPVATVVIFLFIFRHIPFGKFIQALRGADYVTFLILMVPNSLFYFGWDTLVLDIVLRWFHGPLRYRELLPVRAVTYVVSLMNTQLARLTLAYYLTRRLRAPFFQLASTVLFMTLGEMTHLAIWATCGLLSFPARVPRDLFWVPAGYVLFWLFFLLYARLDFAPWRVLLSPLTRYVPSLRDRVHIREWSIFRTFAQAPVKLYVQFVLLRMPMFLVSLFIHFLAVKTFGMNIPFGRMMAFLPIVFMLAALPITVAHLGTTQAAWIFFFRDYGAGSQLLAFSLASHLAFSLTRGILGLVFLPRAYKDLFEPLRPVRLFTASPPRPFESANP